MSDDERIDEQLLDRVREAYHAPTETPREEMWRTISARMREPATADLDAPVIDLASERERRAVTRSRALWATAAAAALVVLGIGIGRMTAPGGVVAPTASAPADVESATTSRSALGMAASEHFGRSESLLTMVQADARAGSLNPATAAWARELLAETRLLLDARSGDDPEMRTLLEDLELVLAQVVGAAELETGDRARLRTELDLAVRGLENGEVLPRIQAAMPADQAGV